MSKKIYLLAAFYIFIAAVFSGGFIERAQASRYCIPFEPSTHVFLYEHNNYNNETNGDCLNLLLPVSGGTAGYDLTQYQMSSGGSWNDQVSSLGFPSGYTVTLYQDVVNGQGRGGAKVFTGGTSYVGDDFNDQASFVEIASNATTGPPLPPPPSPPAGTPTLSLSASPSSISSGKRSILTWSSTNVTTCIASGSWIGRKTINGTTPVSPSPDGAYPYTLTCSNATGATVSKTATVVVGAPKTLSITSHPSNQIVTAPATATFNVSATGGTVPLKYQWKKNGVNVVGGSNATTASYTTPATSGNDNNSKFTVVVTDNAGKSVTSNPAILTVRGPQPLGSCTGKIILYRDADNTSKYCKGFDASFANLSHAIFSDSGGGVDNQTSAIQVNDSSCTYTLYDGYNFTLGSVGASYTPTPGFHDFRGSTGDNTASSVKIECAPPEPTTCPSGQIMCDNSCQIRHSGPCPDGSAVNECTGECPSPPPPPTCPAGQMGTPPDCYTEAQGEGFLKIKNPGSAETVEELLGILMSWLYVFSIPLLSLAVIYGAFQIMTSGGSEEKYGTGIKSIKWGVIGFIVILLAGAIAAIVRSVLGG